MAKEIEEFSLDFLQMFPGLDLVRASARFGELGKDQNRLAAEYFRNDYPKAPPLQSADFMNVEDEVPPAYQLFALKFLTNEFPKLNVDFLSSKLREFGSHLYPTFHYIFKKYFLCDSAIHPEDEEEGPYIYGLVNDVKDNYLTISSPKQNIANEQAQALRAYPLLAQELMHISKKRDSYKVKIADIKNRINKRMTILVVYFEQKNRSSDSEEEVQHPLFQCPICDMHCLDEEFCHCKRGHSLCQYCLRGEIQTNCFAKGVAKTVCVVEGCGAEYHDTGIKRALGNKKYQRFNTLFKANQTSAFRNSENSYSCPHCPYFFISYTKPETVNCQDCGRITCLKCGKETNTHPGGKCPVQKRKEDLSVQTAQELMGEQERAKAETEARVDAKNRQSEAFARALLEEQRHNAEVAEQRRQEMLRLQREEEQRMQRERQLAEQRAAQQRAAAERKQREDLEISLKEYVNEKIAASTICVCPGCGRNIVKDQGCNHVHCPRCNCDFCYQCRQRTPDYNGHFARGPCKQFMDQNEMDAASRSRAKIDAEREWRARHSHIPLAASVRLRL